MHPSLHLEGSETFKWLPQEAFGKVSLSGLISSTAAFLRDMFLANLKTSARVTSLLILVLENGYEYMIGEQTLTLTLTS